VVVGIGGRVVAVGGGYPAASEPDAPLGCWAAIRRYPRLGGRGLEGPAPLDTGSVDCPAVVARFGRRGGPRLFVIASVPAAVQDSVPTRQAKS